MTSNEIIIPTGFGTGSKNGELTYNKQYKVYDNHLKHTKTKKTLKITKKEGRGTNEKLTLSKRYEQVVRDNWIDYVKENEDNLPLRINANKILQI